MTLEEKEKFFLYELDGEGLDFAKIFGNKQPVHLEIGSGRGEFITEIAILEPETNFLGLELKQKRIKTILKKLDPERHTNLRLLMVKVDDQMLKMIPSRSVERFYIFHPDPWPKKKHHKHRLIQTGFLQELNIVLEDGGEVLITTDHENYMRWIVKHFQQSGLFDLEHEEGFSREPFEGHIETHFEQKLKKKGYPPFYMRFRKR